MKVPVNPGLRAAYVYCLAVIDVEYPFPINVLLT